MNQPRRVQRKRTKGWKMPENTVYVGRPGKWGNKYRIIKMKDERFRLFRVGLHNGIYGNTIGYFNKYPEAVIHAVARFKADLSLADEIEIRTELKGKNLACFCKEGEPCHADVLLKIANQ